jgi:NADH-quinone oxidoreductase subunit I
MGCDCGAGEKIKKFVKSVLFLDFIKGLHVTLGYLFSKSITIRYPDDEKWIPYQRYRGRHTLNLTSEGKELCVACELCSKACPTNCITVIPMEDDTGIGITDRVAKVWKVDLVRCLFCGYCEDACPTRAVRLGREYELSCVDLKRTKYEKKELLLPQSVPEHIKGGVVAKAKFVRNADGIKVVANLGKIRKMRW